MKNILSQEELNKLTELCEMFEIENYTVNSDGSIDVNGSVNLDEYNGLHWIPIKFNKVSGDFNCNASDLTTLKNAPRIVGGEFNVGYNNIESLEFSPEYIGGTFFISDNKLRTLEFLPQKLNNLNLNRNKLKSLENLGEINGYLSVDYNKLKSLKGCPRTIGSDFHCTGNKLTSLEFMPQVIPGKFVCEDNRLTTLIDCASNINGDVYLRLNNFPSEFDEIERGLSADEMGVFIKYQNQLDVWTESGLNMVAARELVNDIKEGLR